MRTISNNQFDGGMVNDPRDNSSNTCRVCKNFDAFTDKFRLIPYRDSENGDTNSATAQIINYQYTNSTLYGLGVVSSSAKAQVFTKTDFTNQTWTTPANNTSSAGTKDNNVFITYKTKIYGLRGGTTVWAFDTTGGVWNDSVTSISYTNTAQGLVHSKDDMLYIPYDNKIAKFDNSTWTTPVLTLPSNLIITSICEYGNYLAIGCRPTDAGGKSRVYLWDRDATLATLPEIIDWGNSDLYVLEQLGGYLIGVSEVATNALKYRLIFKYYSGTAGAVKFREFISTIAGSSGSLRQAKQRANDRLFFMSTITLNGTMQEGVWSIGRNSVNVPFAVTIDRTPNNDTATVNGLLNNFILVGDYMFQSYQTNSAYAMSKTNDQASYTATSIYETVINPELPERIRGAAGERSRLKEVKATRLSTEPLPSGASSVFRYRMDSASGSFTTLTTDTATGSVGTEGSMLDAAGTAITAGREVEFRIESTGGAVPTEYKYMIEPLKSLL